ncbi:MAG: Hpt domain-containing protein [Mariniphaga sp.]|nr:Hpt domain-containing protein [Mariniphaga sp.]MDD4426441.1 Hpt domain-containing protein [Mariniphaga sp.]
MFEYVNLSYLDSISDGDSDFQKEVIQVFLEQIPRFLNNMRKYLSENDNEMLMREAHTAKSSVLVFMMEDTGNLFKAIKQLAEKNQTENISEMIDQIDAALQGASRELTDYIKTI